MKQLKFTAIKSQWILDGIKTSTLRIFDDKDLQVNDQLELVNSETKEVFIHAEITDVLSKALGEVKDVDLEGHEKWESQKEMIATLRQFYGESVSERTPVKIVRFRLT